MNKKYSQVENAFLKAKEKIIFNKNKYLFNKSDFTRLRKMSLDNFIDIITSMEGRSLPTELLNTFKNKSYTSSAFVQSRNKVNFTLFKDLLCEFNNNLNNFNDLKFKGFKLLAIDGSVLNIANDENDKETRIKYNQFGYSNNVHINALYDVLNKYYLDCVIQGAALNNERKAVEYFNIPKGSIVILDRGYESHKIIHDLDANNIYFVMRVKDINSNGLIHQFDLPNKTFDKNIEYKITYKKKYKDIKFVQKSYFDYGDKEIVDIKYRLIRFKLKNGNYETLITNLTPEQMCVKDLKYIYKLRWQIETSFYVLKYDTGVLRLHSKKKNSIYQEVYAKIIFFNYVSGIIRCTKPNKGYNINIGYATEICRLKFKKIKISYKHLLHYQLKDRPNRHDRRKKIAQKPFISFMARAA